jgi:hypothetical protein
MTRRIFRLPWRTAQRIRDDVDEELLFHIAMRAEELQSRGLAPDAALAEARRQFGDLEDARRYLRRMDRSTEAARRRRDYMGELRNDIV